MFSQNLNAIMRTLDIRRAPVPRVPETLKATFEHEARRALAHTLRVPPLSERRANPSVYQALARERRRDLEALLVFDAADNGRLLDLICAICEESRWAEGPGAIFEDEARPEIDLQAADTAVLLGWAWHLRGAALGVDGARVHARLLQEARQRVLQPLVACDDYLCSTAVYCAAVTALLFLEDDRERLFLALKPLLRRLDAACACAERDRLSLPERLTDACAIADFAYLMRRVTAGAVDVTRDVPCAAWLDEILFSHVQEDWFFTCTQGAVRLTLSGAAVYRLGCLTGDGALRSLGAALARAHALPSPTATGWLLDVSLRADMEADFSPAPRLKHAALEDGRLMAARVDVSAAYAAEEGVRAHQRTLMLARGEYGVQLVDVFDLAAPRDLRYAFRSPFSPEFFGGGARLGPLLLSWEGKPTAETRPVPASESFPDGQWDLLLSYPEAGPRAMFTFFMRHV